MPQASTDLSTVQLYVSRDQDLAFWDKTAAMQSIAPLTYNLPPDAKVDIGEHVFFAQDRDGDSIVSPFAADIADWTEGRSGVCMRHLTVM